MTVQISDETLSAYLDGALDPEARARISAHLMAHPKDRARLDAMRDLDDQLRAAFPLEEPRAQTPGAPVISLAERRAARVPRGAGGGLAAAAAVAALAFGISNFGPGSQAEVPNRGAGHLAAGPVTDPDLRTALTGTLSGTEVVLSSGMRVEPVAAFQMADGQLCREVFATAAAQDGFDHALICAKTGGAWDIVAVAVHDAVEVDDRFVPALGAGDAALEAMLDAMGAGLALDPTAEAAAIETGWQ